MVHDLVELRAANEPFATRLAAQRRDRSDLDALGAALSEMTRPRRPSDTAVAPIQAFHRTVLTASRNNAFVALAPAVTTCIAWLARYRRQAGKLIVDPVPGYRRIYDAIRAGNADDAEAAARQVAALDMHDAHAFIRDVH